MPLARLPVRLCQGPFMPDPPTTCVSGLNGNSRRHEAAAWAVHFMGMGTGGGVLDA